MANPDDIISWIQPPRLALLSGYQLPTSADRER